MAANPSEVLVLLVLDVPLCHCFEYYAISWMATFASAAVFDVLRKLHQEFLKSLPGLIEDFIWFLQKLVDLLYFLCSTSKWAIFT
ncbi:hypothetical protein Tco_0831485 [Tanacetum coccineum]